MSPSRTLGSINTCNWTGGKLWHPARRFDGNQRSAFNHANEKNIKIWHQRTANWEHIINAPKDARFPNWTHICPFDVRKGVENVISNSQEGHGDANCVSIQKQRNPIEKDETPMRIPRIQSSYVRRSAIVVFYNSLSICAFHAFDINERTCAYPT